MDLIFPSDSVIVVAGVPGAGKTTLLQRAVDRDVATVVDTDDRRRKGASRFPGLPDGTRRGPLLYFGHYARIAAAIAGRRPAVIHSRGTHALSRQTIVALARLRGRPAHLILIDADRATAEAGQRARGRTVSPEEMDRQVERWNALLTEGAGEAWASVERFDRTSAGEIGALRFAPAQAGASLAVAA